MTSHNPTRTPSAPACQPDGVRGAWRNVAPIFDLEVADLSGLAVVLSNKSDKAHIVGLNSEQAWLMSRLLYIMQEAGNGADANQEFTRLFRDLARGVGHWPPCNEVIGVNSKGVELCVSL